jgi:hypothetical protein
MQDLTPNASVGAVRLLDVKVRGDGECASVKEFVIPHPIPTWPSFIGEDLSSYLVSYGPEGVHVPHSGHRTDVPDWTHSFCIVIVRRLCFGL